MSRRRAPSPRFRSDDPNPAVQLQPDDIDLLWHIYCNRVIDAAALYRIFPHRSEQVISRRLNKLRKGTNPFITRIPPPVDKAVLTPGSSPFIYALANKGAHTLNQHRNKQLPTSRWIARNNSLKKNTLNHELAASRIMASFIGSALQAGNVRVRYQQDFAAEEMKLQPGGKGRPNTLRTRISNWHGYRGIEATAPDRIFSITANGRKQYIFLELDAGTETITPSEHIQRSPEFWRRTSILRKLVVYASAFENKAHVHEFGLPVFRVLFVTTSEERAENMRACCMKYLHTTPKALFLFSRNQGEFLLNVC